MKKICKKCGNRVELEVKKCPHCERLKNLPEEEIAYYLDTIKVDGKEVTIKVLGEYRDLWGFGRSFWEEMFETDIVLPAEAYIDQPDDLDSFGPDWDDIIENMADAK
ncbi:MAG TPA: hypothetical protein P5127_04720 [Oscillospiraceae bacterium]|jgi:hypothetical protein|nr:hypothetical protein [Oscillospiraceae bacterium]